MCDHANHIFFGSKDGKVLRIYFNLVFGCKPINIWVRNIRIYESHWFLSPKCIEHFHYLKSKNKGHFMAKEGKKITEKKVFGKWL